MKHNGDKKGIMQSHEEFIKALKLAVKDYTLTELDEGLAMSKANLNYSDYIEIFAREIAIRIKNK